MTKLTALRGFIVPVITLIVWQILSTSGVFRPEILPSPVAVVARWVVYLTPIEAYQPGTGWFGWLVSGEMLADAAGDSGRRVTVVERLTQAIDHPEVLTIPETGYLKGALLEVLD